MPPDTLPPLPDTAPTDPLRRALARARPDDPLIARWFERLLAGDAADQQHTADRQQDEAERHGQTTDAQAGGK